MKRLEVTRRKYIYTAIVVFCWIPLRFLQFEDDAVYAPKFYSASDNPYLMIVINPNPTSGLLKVKIYGLYSTRNLPAQLRIYGLRGEQVADLTTIFSQNNNGSWSEFSATINFAASGVFLMVLKIGKYTVSQKFLVVK